MNRACASVVEARGSFSRGFLHAGSPASPFASAAASCGAFLAARSASLRAASCCLACSSSVTASAARTRRSRSSVARRRAAACLRLGAPGSLSSCVRRSCTAFSASHRHSCKVECRRNDAAPAEARTRTPSWATRSRLATPARTNAVQACTSRHSSAAPRSPVHCLDGRKQRRQIEPLDETPHQTPPVIVRQKPVQADRAPSRLHALGKSQPRQTPTHALRRRLLGQKIEQPFLFTRCHQSTLDENQTWRF